MRPRALGLYNDNDLRWREWSLTGTREPLDHRIAGVGELRATAEQRGNDAGSFAAPTMAALIRDGQARRRAP